MASSDAKRFFAKSVHQITEHLKKVFQQENGIGISTIIIVGGYVESLILIEGIRPSVLRGAVIFGHDTSRFRQRLSKYSYSIDVFQKLNPVKHDKNHKYENDWEIRCGEIFSKLVEVDQRVTVGEYQGEDIYTIHAFGKDGDIKLTYN